MIYIKKEIILKISKYKQKQKQKQKQLFLNVEEGFIIPLDNLGNRSFRNFP